MRITLNLFFLFIISIISSSFSLAQKEIRIMFYNTENLFLPEHKSFWGYKRYNHKLNQIAKVITAVGEWNTVPIVGLCEIESDSVLHHLLTRTSLKHSLYDYYITSGSDKRGINVGLLYQKDKFHPLGESEYKVFNSQDASRTTRNILHVWGRFPENNNIVDILVCHLPSKYGGEKESEQFRIDANALLRNKCDSLHSIRDEAKIIIMGDFNDSPAGISQSILLHSNPSIPLKNLFNDGDNGYSGSHKYQKDWSQLDHFIVSAYLTDTISSIHIKDGSVQNFDPPFLFISDKTWNGKRPFRSFHGFKYEGGYSDHLPIMMDLIINTTSD